MVNFNYPDNFDNDMFSKMECEAELMFDEVDGGYRSVINHKQEFLFNTKASKST